MWFFWPEASIAKQGYRSTPPGTLLRYSQRNRGKRYLLPRYLSGAVWKLECNNRINSLHPVSIHSITLSCVTACLLYYVLSLQYFIIIIIIIRLHRSTTYVDAAYCYRPSRVVCRSVCWSVTLVSPAKTAAPIEMPIRSLVSPGNHLLDGSPDTPCKGAILREETRIPL